MDDVSGTPSTVRVATTPGSSYVEWSAVLAGGAMAAALSFVLLSFGSAIGLSFVSPWKDVGASSKVVGGFAVFWAMAQQIGAAMAGAYIAGRMRMRWADASSDEVEFRDGLHGGLVWAVGVVITAAFLLSAAGSAVRTGTEVASRVASTTYVDPLAYQIDTMLRAAPRTPTQGTAAPGAAGAVPTAGTPSTASTPDSELRGELLRTFSRAVANGALAEGDRAYLASVIVQRTGLTQQDAERRVTEAWAEANRVAKETAEKARRNAIVVGLVTAASLVISLGAAWWAAIQGGNHRDNSVPPRFNLPPVYRRPAA